MTVQWSDGVRNGVCDAIETAVGTAPKLQIYSGSAPANCAAAATGTKLAEFALDSDWMEASGAGGTAGVKRMIKAAAAVSASNFYTTTGLATASAGYYRIVNTAGSTCHEQGTVTVTGGGGDVTLDNTSIASGQTVNLTGYQKTAPGA